MRRIRKQILCISRSLYRAYNSATTDPPLSWTALSHGVWHWGSIFNAQVLLLQSRLTGLHAGETMAEDLLQTELTRASVQAAHEAIKPFIHRTPVFSSRSLSSMLAGKNILYFKAENLQKGGAFKFRGASYSLGRLTEDQLRKGVCTHSSGMFQIYRTPNTMRRHLRPYQPDMQGTMPVLSPWPPKSVVWDVSWLWSVVFALYRTAVTDSMTRVWSAVEFRAAQD